LAAKKEERCLKARPADAISNVYNWQLAGIRKVIKSFDRGEGIPHKRVKEWVESWGSSRELPKPARLKT
jgi:predicted transcriptional regulator